MKNIILNIIKGMLIGVANVIPGVSGGTIAVSTGVYERIINAINNITQDFKRSIKILWPFVVGMIIGIVELAFAITFLLERFPVPTTACFIGLVLGGVPALHAKIKDEKLKWTHMVAFVFTLALIIVPAVIAVDTPAIETVELNFVNIMILILLGITSSAAMVVPGVSGSLILMMLGYYEFIIGLVKNCVSNLVNFNFEVLLQNVLLAVPFGFGVIFGIVGISKIIAYALKKWPNATIWGILGLVVASPFAIIVKMGTITISPLIVIVSIISFILGFLASNKLGEVGK